MFDREEFKMFRRAEDFLWAVRCHMHFVTGRAEERLSFDIQREIAVRLGYTAHPGMRDVERFMKHYFLVAKDVGDLTAILSSALEEREAKPVPVLDRVVARFKPRPRRVVLESDDFIADHNRINIADADAFRRDPVNLIRIFRLAQKHNLAFHPDAMRVATRSLKLIDQKLREDRTANQLFFEILTSEGAEVVLRRMNEAGVLGRFVRAFGRIVAMMQFNMYHHYTVDEHLLRCIGILADIEAGGSDEFVLASELMKTIQTAASRAALRGAVPARHRQGPHRGSFDRRRAHRAALLPAARPLAGRDRDGGLAGRAAPRDVDASRSRATSPTARRSRISPPWCSRSSA